MSDEQRSSTPPGRLRIRAALDRWFGVVLVVAVVVALVGGWFTYTAYAERPTTTETRSVSSWESTGDFTHRATVVNGTEAFPEGTVLRNRSVYFRSVTPVLDGRFRYTYQATEGGNLTADVTLVLVARSVSDSGREYWRTERPLANASATLAPGETLRVPYSTNVTAAARRADRIERNLGGTPGDPSISIHARVGLNGSRNGQPVNRSRTYPMNLTVDRSVYSVDDAGPTRESGRTRTQVVVPAGSSPTRRLGGPLLLLVGLGGAGSLVAARHHDLVELDETERSLLEYHAERKEFDDWITTATLPDEAVDSPRVEIDSLQGLVDLAIDSDRRVIADPGRSQYFVYEEGLLYTYVPPDPGTVHDRPDDPDPIEDAVASIQFTTGDEDEPRDGPVETGDGPVEEAPVVDLGLEEWDAGGAPDSEGEVEADADTAGHTDPDPTDDPLDLADGDYVVLTEVEYPDLVDGDPSAVEAGDELDADPDSDADPNSDAATEPPMAGADGDLASVEEVFEEADVAIDGAERFETDTSATGERAADSGEGSEGDSEETPAGSDGGSEDPDEGTGDPESS